MGIKGWFTFLQILFYFSHLGKIFQGITLNSNLTIVSKVFVCLVGCFYCVFLLFFVCFGFPWKETNKKHRYSFVESMHSTTQTFLNYSMSCLFFWKWNHFSYTTYWSIDLVCSTQQCQLPFLYFSAVLKYYWLKCVSEKKKQKRMVILYYLYVENWRVLLSFPDSLEWQDKFYSQ